ncbi:MAG: cysteine desulfurase-like protein [Ornithinimicrobium sp.]|uniref:cysteine desulfurase-like protein n=1 Tax=Ornithinimicrobium sp. TaxID=1977084 RepID=UPI003D9BB1E8
MAYDVQAVRAAFPALDQGIAFFDGPGGSQTPTSVAEAVANTMTSGISNRGDVTASERRAEWVVKQARAAMGDLLGTDPGGVVFGRSMTALTYDLARTLSRGWGPGDEVVVTSLDHDANIRPWVQAAEAVGAGVRWAHFDADTGRLPVEAVQEQLSERTRLVAVTAASNVIGTRPDVPAIAAAAHAVGALVHVDAVHLAPHAPLDRARLGADVIACSPYKFFGPHCGVQAADPVLLETLHPAKLAPSTDRVPERFELGTLPYELLAGTTAAVDFIAGLDPEATGDRRARIAASLAAATEHEDSLRGRLEARLQEVDGLVSYSRAGDRTPTVYFTVEGIESLRLSRHVAAEGVNAPCSNFYAIEASRRLGLGDGGAVRAGISAYTDDDDVDRLVDALHDAVAELRC